MAKSRKTKQSAPDLRQVRGTAPERNPTVRVLAAFSDHADCPLASLGMAAGVDFDRVLAGTSAEAPFGQSPFAFQRGELFENLIRKDNYEKTAALLREEIGFPNRTKAVNVRSGFAHNRGGLAARAKKTRELLSDILGDKKRAPNLVDGAVLTRKVAGVQAYFEADAIAARVGPTLHTGEVKSFPVVDGRTDATKVGAALDQAAIYTLLSKELVVELGGDESLVSTEALLITPKNVGLQPALAKSDVTARMRRIERLLTSAPSADDIALEVPKNLNFGTIAAQDQAEETRLKQLDKLADRVGTTYKDSCLASCGLGRFCRGRAYRCGDPAASQRGS